MATESNVAVNQRLRKSVMQSEMGSVESFGEPPPFSSCAIKRRQANHDSLAALENDHLVLILQHLPVQSVLSFGMTCRHYQNIASSDAVWSAICQREWRSLAAEVPAVARSRNGWAGLYRDLMALDHATWHRVEQLESVPKARASHSMSMVGGQLAMYGGGCHGGRHLDDTWLTAPESLLLPDGPARGVRWRLASTEQPAGRFQQSCTVVGDTLLMFGGINDFGTRSDDTWVFRGGGGEAGQSSWTRLQVAASPAPRGAHAASFAGGSRVVVFGGIGQDGVRLRDTWVLDMGEEPLTWGELALDGGPQARSGHSLTWVGGDRLVMFGGRGAKLDVLSDVWVLEVGGPEPRWIQLEWPHPSPSHSLTVSPEDTCLRGPGPRAGHSATPILGGRVLIYGGEDERRGRKSDVWVLDPHAGVPVGNQMPWPAAAAAAAAAACAWARASTGSEFAVPEIAPSPTGDLQVVPAGGAEDGRSDRDLQAVPSADPPEVYPGRRGGRSERRRGAEASERGRGRGMATGTVPQSAAAVGGEQAGGHADRRDRGRHGGNGDSGDTEGRMNASGNGVAQHFSGLGAGTRTKRTPLWKEVNCRGEMPTQRSYHGACAMGGGCAVLVFGGMVDGERRGHTAAGLTFDDQFFVLQLTQARAPEASG